MVTASAPERLEYLRTRYPYLDQLLKGSLASVISAKEMVEIQLEAEQKPEIVTDSSSARAHSIRPRSLAVKTPWAVSQASEIPPYDLLVDDSDTTAKVFCDAGLGGRLLFVQGKYPWSGYGVEILKTAVKRLLLQSSGENTAIPLPCSEEGRQAPSGIPTPPKIQDPLYFPLLHYSDQF